MVELVSATHTYMHNGRVVPGVTNTIRPLAPDFERFAPESARQRGTLVHALCAVMDGRDDLWPEDMPDGMEDDLSGYCDAWARFKKESGVTMLPEMIEHRVYHPAHQYAGTVDRVVDWNGLRWVLDIKTGIHDDSHHLQVAAYREAYNAEAGPDSQASGATLAYLDAQGGYTVRNLPYWELRTSFTTFLALRTVAVWRQDHGLTDDTPAPWVPLPEDEEFKL
ncbi:hypothetical protein LCGC14_1959150 [marine sediment metagenome]|uniref:PD-(D/E)XK endonuclease-like domain-containing protein n=1 Tax=marine sediment metagenome TaxID=412755 RepID=A0A0F9FF23_9ZZZZ